MITPIEIRQHSFKKSLRGYDKEEVHSFLNTLSLEWEKLLEVHKKTKTELEKTQSSLENFKQMETVLHKTLLQAEETSKSTMENAKKDAELKVQEAENKSNEIVKTALDERRRIEMQVHELVSRRNEILDQLKSFLKGQSERIHSFEEREMKRFEPVKEPEPLKREAPAAENRDVRSFFESGADSGDDNMIINEIADEL